MTSVRAKLIVGLTLLVGAMGYLAYAGLASGWSYFESVDRFLATPASRSLRARIHGRVALDDADIDPARLHARFTLMGDRGNLPVEYRGPLPDSFAPGAEVVIQGRMGDDGVFHADTLLTKCASKYEPREPGAEPLP